MKEILPKRIIINLDETGAITGAVAQYRIKEDGATEGRVRTIGVKNGFTLEKISAVIAEAISHVYTGEGIDEKAVVDAKATLTGGEK